MANNVIILGAGASADAGIPLLRGFGDKFSQFYNEYSESNKPEELKIFSDAWKIIDEIGNFHTNAEFDERNIEDLLSILKFDSYSSNEGNEDKQKIIEKAISMIIEKTCQVKYDRNKNPQASGNDIYREFWRILFAKYADNASFPTIISFNYDLVLERALFQALNSTWNPNLSFDGIILDYHFPNSKYTYYYKIVQTSYIVSKYDLDNGISLIACDKDELLNPVQINFLKLHGSLNFTDSDSKDWNPGLNPPTNNVEYPIIVPPVSNKEIYYQLEDTWRTALITLRKANKIVIVGYSLPDTDIYIQYFLKTALGPNNRLDSITIFDPVIFDPSMREEKELFIKRYTDCFSTQIRKRLSFEPPANAYGMRDGKFSHFVHLLSESRGILYQSKNQ